MRRVHTTQPLPQLFSYIILILRKHSMITAIQRETTPSLKKEGERGKNMLQEVYWISSHVDVRTLYAAPRLDRNQIEKHGVFRLQRRVTDSPKQEAQVQKKSRTNELV
jgi:hypothetical protein